MTRKARVIVLAGVRFVSGAAGDYRSTCGRYWLTHQFEGRVIGQWELYALDGVEGETDRLIDYGILLYDIRCHAKRGDFTLEAA